MLFDLVLKVPYHHFCRILFIWKLIIKFKGRRINLSGEVAKKSRKHNFENYHTV